MSRYWLKKKKTHTSGLHSRPVLQSQMTACLAWQIRFLWQQLSSQEFEGFWLEGFSCWRTTKIQIIHSLNVVFGLISWNICRLFVLWWVFMADLFYYNVKCVNVKVLITWFVKPIGRTINSVVHLLIVALIHRLSFSMPFPVLLVVHLPTVIFYFLSQLSSFGWGGWFISIHRG